MRTAIDSSVLWSIFKEEDSGKAWLDLLTRAAMEGDLVICEIVFAEISPLFHNLSHLQNILESMHVLMIPTLESTAFFAGNIFREYRRKGGPRSHMIPDFMIAAHAQYQADRFAAKDRGYCRPYFPKLKLLGLDLKL